MKGYYLLLLDGGAIVKRVPLEKGKLVIGRSDDADVVISSKDVSRRHAAISYDGTAVCIEDLDSTNGTFVNGTRITKTELGMKDEIRIGDITLLLDDGTCRIEGIDKTEIGRKGDETIMLEGKLSSLREKLGDKGLEDEFKNLEELVMKSRKRLANIANADKLTGLYNRQYFDKIATQEFEHAKKVDSTISILFIDVDFFKHVNDTCGHKKGDEALKVIARLVLLSCRKSDIVARYGGEEIVVILPDTLSQDALQVGMEINRIVAAQTPRLLGMKLTVSIGVATFPNDGKTLREIIEHADDALYHAKRGGRDRVCTYDEARR
ncbi:MAG: GGDEF domain-containing protein [candidate division WOR-3 bacterium]|nr:MAG: GGDEF domain-containing protein [candidate division WOR-3 bacterium]